MEEDGLVGPFVGSKSRDVNMTWDEYLAREQAMEEAEAEIEASGGEAGAEASEPSEEPLPGDGVPPPAAALVADADADADAPPFVPDPKAAEA